MAITTKSKQRMSLEIGLGANDSEEQSKEKITALIEEQLRSENKCKGRSSSMNEDIINIAPPAYLDIKKDYTTKNEKVTIIHNYLAYTVPR